MAERELTTYRTLCAMKQILPGLLKKLAEIKDYRKKNVKHPLTLLPAYAILLFALHYSSRREANREISTPVVRENLKALFPELETLPHGDTLYRLLAEIEVGKMQNRHRWDTEACTPGRIRGRLSAAPRGERGNRIAVRPSKVI